MVGDIVVVGINWGLLKFDSELESRCFTVDKDSGAGGVEMGGL